MKIVFLDTSPLNPGDLSWHALEALGNLHYYERTPDHATLERCQDATIIISNKVKLTADHLAQLPALRCICVAATGYNNIDIAAAQQRGIRVMNVAGYSTPAVAQQVFALLLALTNKVAHYAQGVRNGRWSKSADFSYWDSAIPELQGKVMGIYGFGKTGQAVGQIALAFGMSVIAVHRHPERDARPGVEFVSPEILWQKADVISLHVPLSPATHHLINAKTLGQMKSSAWLIDTGRGDLVHEIELRQALEAGEIAGAGLDVLSSEPPAADHPLLDAPNCVITPHQAWASLEARQRLLAGICENIKAFQAGKERNVIV